MNKKRQMFIKTITASLVRRRSRMIVALLAIIVGATTLSGLEMIYYDVPRQMSVQFRSYGANIIFTPDNGEYITDDDLEKGIAVFTAGELEGYTPYRYENTVIHNMPITLAGISFDSVTKTSPYWHVEGTLPAVDGEVLVGAKVAESLGIRTGDVLEALNSFEVTEETDLSQIPEYELYTDPSTGETFCDHVLKMKVTGILETGGSEEEYIYVSHADISYLTLVSRGYDIVEVSVASTSDRLNSFIDSINSSVDGIRAKTVKRVTASESTVLTKLQALVFIVTTVVLVLTMICVATTMTAVIAERRQEIGLRKALGADNRSIIAQFMCEGLLLGAAGGIIGSILGYYFAQYVSLNVFSSSITFRPLLIPVTILVSVAVTGISCLIPIRSAIDVDPALVLKGE